MEKVKIFRPIVKWVREKADKYKGKIIKSEGNETLNAGFFLALMMFVAIPLPGTGAWTGSLVAALFGLPKRSSLLAISLGVLICGVIMCLASYGVLGFLKFLL
jgi:uncharacterized membrane protein